jgi:Fe-S-cluster containining protein
VTEAAGTRVRVLDFHAGYRCRNTGVCCSSGWDIPVEPEVELQLRNALASGALRVPEADVSSIPPPSEASPGAPCFRAIPGLPHAASVVFASDSSGRCVFLDPDRRCAVHRQLGPGALPSACRDFPRVVTLTPLGVSITLSHYCPTAAGMLFAPVTPRDPRLPAPEGCAIAILENPTGFPPTRPYEGLDARDAFPPLLRPGVLMDWPSLERWEAFAVSVMGDQRRTPESALDVLSAAAEAARTWAPGAGPFGEHLASSLRGAPDAAGDEDSAGGDPARGEARSTLRASPVAGVDRRSPDDRGAWRLVAECVPHRALLPPAPEGLEDAERRLVAPRWSSLALPLRRWLAAKAFASWLVLQGDGLRTAVLGLRTALGVLRAEAARGCADAGRALDAELLKEAVRRADLLLVHLADPEALARRLAKL